MSLSKIIYHTILLLFLLMTSFSSVYTDKKIVWNKTEHDFGNMKQGERQTTSFICYNKSDTVLIIENVLPSCGCLIPSWNRNPIKSGDSTILQVGFDSKGKIKKHVKTIAVYTNQGLFELIVIANISH